MIGYDDYGPHDPMERARVRLRLRAVPFKFKPLPLEQPVTIAYLRLDVRDSGIPHPIFTAIQNAARQHYGPRGGWRIVIDQDEREAD